MKLVLLCLVSIACFSDVQAQDLAVVASTVYPSPNAAPAANTTVLIRAGKIVAVGPSLVIPTGIRTLSCANCIVFAGFWNNHVHFIEPKWSDAAHIPAARLTRQLQQMLTHSGFTTVVDTGSDGRNTIDLRRRIENGEVAGPQIYTAGAPLYPVNAIPFYLHDLPKQLRSLLGQPASPEDAKTFVERNIALGTDIVKLFTGSYAEPDHVVAMQVPIARAAVEAGHRHNQLVFAHPSNAEGVRVAMESGVDVLAHAPDTVEGVNDALISQLVAHRMTMIPTLKLFSQDRDLARIRAIVYSFHQLGGPLMFGTDTGFETDYDLTEEYRQLQLAGLSYRDVLAMLTTAPAERFHVADHKGQISPGLDGDLTILSSDPASGDLAAFTKVLYTIRKGQILYSATGI